VQIGTTGAAEAKKITGAQIRTFDSAPVALQELRNRNVDAVVHDAPAILYAIKNNLRTQNQRTTAHRRILRHSTPKNSPNLNRSTRV